MPKRKVDRKLVRYFDGKYGPFDLRILQNNTIRCDFCGEVQISKLVIAQSVQVKKVLYICFTCEALPLLIGEKAAEDFEFSLWASPSAGLTEFAAGQADFAKAESGARHIQQLIGLSEVDGKEDVSEIANQASAFHRLSLGMGWKIIPNLLRQYEERKSLTEKQTAVLIRYNRACASECKHLRRSR